MKKIFRSLPVSLFIVFIFVQIGAAQKGALKIDYTVALKDPSLQQFHITTDIRNISQPRLDLSLPTWAPGWYTVENYFKNVLRFRITDATGRVLPHTMSKKQTWNVDTRGLREIRVDYDYQATVLALNQAKITDEYAFFQGIELFLEPVGHKNEPSTVHFLLPANWKIISALKETVDPLTFTADNYDALVDAPTEMGNFDVTKFMVEGKPHYFVANPAGAFSAEKTQRFTQMMSKVVEADSAMFGGLPYDKYVMFYFFEPAESNASGALEHLNAFVAFAAPGNLATPESIIGTAAHEYFHLWNVKRIRPAEMWPYDYSRENETPSLWVSEGFTNYYGVKARYRGGLMKPEDFLSSAASAAAGVENDDAREYISPAESSVSTWVGYDTPVAFGISYYTQGQNLGALLDLSILNDTRGRRGLDDVMRTLFSDFYKRGRGFTTEDMISVINRLTGKDYHDFYRRFVLGTDVPNYDQIFGYAGYRIDMREQSVTELGFSARVRNGGVMINAVQPATPALKAGLRAGDVITKIDGESVAAGYRFDSIAGKTVKLTVNRNGEMIELPFTVGTRVRRDYLLVPMANPSAEQMAIRNAWLKR